MPRAKEPPLNDISAWKRSRTKPDNIWRVYDGVTLSVFKTGIRSFRYCIATFAGPYFSTIDYPTVERAIRGLGKHLKRMRRTRQ